MNDLSDQDDDDFRRDIPVLESTAALGLALAVASREKADAFLDEQTQNIRVQRQARLAEKQAKLLDLQAEDLADDSRIRHWSIRIRHISDVMKLAFELALAFIFVAIAFSIGTALWMAAHDDSLVIEAFSVPPDMAARGLTGQAIAAQLQDKLGAMQAATDSARPAASYTNNWGNDIKVEIPNTGVSIGEFYRYLASWLGHQMHIRGEVYRDGAKVVVAARAGGDGGTKIMGPESDLDTLLQQTAESIYRETQPYRYAVYLGGPPHFDSAGSLAILNRLATEGDPLERAWAHVGIGSIYEDTDPTRAPAEEREAAALAPGLGLAAQNLASEAHLAGHAEESLSDKTQDLRLLESGDAGISARAHRISLPRIQGAIASDLGDALAALSFDQDTLQLPDYSHIVEVALYVIPTDLAQLHEPNAARAALARVHPSDPPGIFFADIAAVETDASLGDWKSTLEAGQRAEASGEIVAKGPLFSKTFVRYRMAETVWPYMAGAMAAEGDIERAEALIARTPLDSYLALRIRAEIAMCKKDMPAARSWLARAVALAPSIPFAYAQWGALLLSLDDPDDAIAKFETAHAKGPHFADPLEMWGEALMLKNRSDLALAKFEEASGYAPRWGRLRLKWGEALLYAGRADDARKQFDIARSLELTASERAKLEKFVASHG
jgi:tetratricopeptide (TPR) repeat protein